MKKKILFLSAYNSPFVVNDFEILQNHFIVKNLDLSNKSKLAYFLLIFKEILRTDIVYCWFADFAAYLAVKMARFFHKKIIVVVGGYEVSNLPGYGGLTNKNRASRLKYTLNNATKVITISDFSKAEIENLNLDINAQKISIGIELQENLVPKTNTILTVGSVTKSHYKLKGLDTFVKVSLQFPEYEFKIIGNYDEEIKEKLLIINPRIKLTGKLEHGKLLDLMKEAKIYCQLSQRESFGLSVLEAMNLGCIPIVTKVGALPELVENKDYHCVYGDIVSTITAIQKAIKTERKEEIIKHVKEKYTLKQREEKLIELIKQIL
ncbi:MAG: glycosyltransferase family 4 protein [Candidatus Cloacimonetes bacterium]|nr:glycosyltransferase family 4 protein [Candidatus Cloacimonadota bacterium]